MEALTAIPEKGEQLDSHNPIRCSQSSTEDDLETSPFIHRKAQTCDRWYRSLYFFVLDGLLVLICLVLLARRSRSIDLPWQGDLTGFVPDFSHRIVSFEHHPEFISNHTSEASLAEAREYWKTIVPPGQGFIAINKDDAVNYDFPKLIHYDLPPGEAPPERSDSGESLGTSIVHSIHCLYTIMAEYDLLSMGREPYNVRHMDHCFDYIRQAIMCGGDMTLAGEDFDGGSTQFGVPHVCKNWEEVYDFLDRERISNRWQFGEAYSHWVPPT